MQGYWGKVEGGGATPALILISFWKILTFAQKIVLFSVSKSNRLQFQWVESVLFFPVSKITRKRCESYVPGLRLKQL